MQALSFIREVRPARALLVGLTCRMGDHDEVNAELAALREGEGGVDVQLAHDGMLLSGFPIG